MDVIRMMEDILGISFRMEGTRMITQMSASP